MKTLYKNILAVICSASVIFALCACNTTANVDHKHEYSVDWLHNSEFHWHAATCGHDVYIDRAPHSFKGGVCVNCGYPQHITFEEFLEDYHDEAINFVNDYVKGDIVKDKEVLSETISLSANVLDQLDHASYAYTYKTGETTRGFNIANVDFVSPIELEDIVNNKIDKDSVSAFITQENVFNFDAKANYEKTTLADAVYYSLTDIFDVKFDDNAVRIFNQKEDADEYLRGFEVLEVKNSTATVYNFDVYRGVNDTEAELIENLHKSAFVKNFTKTSYEIEGTNIYSSKYQIEKFENEVTPPKQDDEEKIESIQQLFEEYSAEVNEGLSEGYNYLIEHVIPKTILGYDASNNIDSKWDFTCDANGNISKINFITTYMSNEKMNTLIISSITLKNPIKINDLNENNIVESFNNATENASYKLEYNFTYDHKIQEENQTLATAIFEAEGINEKNSIKYIYQRGNITNSQLGEVRQYNVVQVTDNGVQEFNILIKNSSSIEGLIENLQNKNYLITADNSYNLGGYTIEKDQTANSLINGYEAVINISFDDEDAQCM